MNSKCNQDTGNKSATFCLMNFLPWNSQSPNASQAGELSWWSFSPNTFPLILSALPWWWTIGRLSSFFLWNKFVMDYCLVMKTQKYGLRYLAHLLGLPWTVCTIQKHSSLPIFTWNLIINLFLFLCCLLFHT